MHVTTQSDPAPIKPPAQKIYGFTPNMWATAAVVLTFLGLVLGIAAGPGWFALWILALIFLWISGYLSEIARACSGNNCML